MSLVERLEVGLRWIALAGVLSVGGVACTAGEESDDTDSANAAQSQASKDLDWSGLYGLKTADALIALRIKPGSPSFAIMAEQRQKYILSDAPSLEGRYDDSKTSISASYAQGCVLTLTKTERGIDIAQTASCENVGISDDFKMNFSLVAMKDSCWEPTERKFKPSGTCNWY